MIFYSPTQQLNANVLIMGAFGTREDRARAVDVPIVACIADCMYTSLGAMGAASGFFSFFSSS